MTTTIRTKPTGRRQLLIRSEDPHEWWTLFHDYVEPSVNDFDIQYADKFANVAELLLDKLMCCGWEEEERGLIEVVNPVCVHRGPERLCTNAEKLADVRLKALRCTDGVRLACAHLGPRFYVAKYVVPMIRHYVWIRKIGPLKNLSRRE